jgi:uncharacterized protein YjbI with pentapeptide repeats
MKKDQEPVLHQGKTFSNIDYSEKRLVNREFVKCEFVNCNFTRSDLSNNDFSDCHFRQCNFSLTNVDNTGLGNIQFTACKILGVDFSKCNKFLFSFNFKECHLDYSSFLHAKIRKTHFIDCVLKEVDFERADLTSSVFKNCDLVGARFINTILEKADFRSAINFSIDPEINIMKKARFTSTNLAGLLYKYNLDVE